MTFNGQNLVAWHDRSTASHVAERDKYADLGFRPLSLSIYGSPSDPRYAAVMVKRPVVIDTRSVIGKSQAEFQTVLNDMAADDFGRFTPAYRRGVRGLLPQSVAHPADAVEPVQGRVRHPQRPTATSASRRSIRQWKPTSRRVETSMARSRFVLRPR